MSIIFVIVIGADNIPIYMKSRNMVLNNNDDPKDDSELLYELHASLDIVEEKSISTETKDQFLGVLNQNEERKIYGLTTATKLKVLMMINSKSNQTLRETEIKAILKELHHAFISATTQNPFYCPGNKLLSKNFELVVQKLFKNY